MYQMEYIFLAAKDAVCLSVPLSIDEDYSSARPSSRG